MSEITGGPSTQVGISFCPNESYLKRLSTSSPAFAIDLLAARQLVKDGIIDAQEAVERVDHAGSLSINTERELRECLGRIVAGQCEAG